MSISGVLNENSSDLATLGPARKFPECRARSEWNICHSEPSEVPEDLRPLLSSLQTSLDEASRHYDRRYF